MNNQSNMKTFRILVTGALAVLAIALSSCANSGTQTQAPTQAAAAAPAAPTSPGSEASFYPVSLAQYFNCVGIYPDGVSFSDGVDGDGNACSSNILSKAHWNGVPFTIGAQAITSSNVVTCLGQAIALAQPGHFSKLEMLAIAVNGAQADQPFTVVYGDDTTQSFTQSLSDWAQYDSNPGESQAVSMDYRDQADGTQDGSEYYLYSYSFTLNPTNTLQSLKLPNNNNVKVFALTLVP